MGAMNKDKRWKVEEADAMSRQEEKTTGAGRKSKQKKQKAGEGRQEEQTAGGTGSWNRKQEQEQAGAGRSRQQEPTGETCRTRQQKEAGKRSWPENLTRKKSSQEQQLRTPELRQLPSLTELRLLP